MKAIKIYKIVWNLTGVSDEEKAKVLPNLPTVKGFTTEDDDFNVLEKVPAILKKKYGYPIATFSFNVLRVVNTIEDLLLLCAPTNEKPKKLFKVNGELSCYGDTCFKTLENRVRQRIWKESHGVDAWDMPANLDEVMIGVENVTGITWEDHTMEQIMNMITKKIEDKTAVNLKSKYEMMDEEEEECEGEE